MNERVFEELKKIIYKHRWEYKFLLTRETRVQDDLGIYGDDSTDFILAYGKAFNVDLTRFMAGDYFDGEGVRLPLFIKKMFGIKGSKKILTLGHLEKGILASRLDDEVINS